MAFSPNNLPSILCAVGGHSDELFVLRETARSGESMPARASVAAGGCAHNVAAGLAALGHPVAHAGLRGRDAAGEVVARSLAARNVSDASLVRDDLQTGRYVAMIEPDGALALAAAAMDAYAHAGELAKHPPFRAAAASADALVLDANGSPADGQALAACRGAQTRLVLLATSAAKAGAIAPLLDEADVLFTNEGEWARLAALWDRPPALAFVTRGERGASVFVDGRERGARAAVPVRVADVIGAGDAFATGALSALLENAPIGACVERGLALAARCVAAPGPLGWVDAGGRTEAA